MFSTSFFHFPYTFSTVSLHEHRSWRAKLYGHIKILEEARLRLCHAQVELHENFCCRLSHQGRVEDRRHITGYDTAFFTYRLKMVYKVCAWDFSYGRPGYSSIFQAEVRRIRRGSTLGSSSACTVFVPLTTIKGAIYSHFLAATDF